MKKLILLFALCFSSFASTRTTVIITITNAPSDADTITINATTLTWKTTVVTPSTQIAIGADSGEAATNLFRHLSSYKISGPVTLEFTDPNSVSIEGASGQAMSASLSAAYGTVGTSSRTDTPMFGIRVPMSAEKAVPQTNNPTLLAQDMGTYSQAPLATNTTLVQNLVQIDGNQTIYGTKTFDIAEIANLYANGTAYVTGNLLVTNTNPQVRFYDSGGGSDNKRTRIYANSDGFTITFVDDADSAETPVLEIGRENGTHTASSIVLGNGTQPVVGVHTNSIITHSTLSEQNYSTGIFGHTRANNTSLANGNNASINFGSKVFIKIKAGPTAAFAICGISGGADGRELILWNATGQNMTVSHDSGVEPTAANRIYTPTGADVATTGNGSARLIYDSEDSRWLLISYQQ